LEKKFSREEIQSVHLDLKDQLVVSVLAIGLTFFHFFMNTIRLGFAFIRMFFVLPNAIVDDLMFSAKLVKLTEKQDGAV